MMTFLKDQHDRSEVSDSKKTQEDFEISDLIGSGNFSEIYRATEKASGKVVAVKKFNKSTVKRLGRENDLLAEKASLKKLTEAGAKHVIKLFDTFATSSCCYISFELLGGGGLFKMTNLKGIPEPLARFYFAQILAGLSEIHNNNIVHRDLKAENFMLSSDLKILKIIDFGSSLDSDLPRAEHSPRSKKKLRLYGHVNQQHCVGTPNFMAPEAINNINNNTASDVWSLGCCLYQILFGIAPFSAGSEFLIFLRVINSDLLFPPKEIIVVSDVVVDLIKMVLVADPAERPSLEKIRNHEWFNEIKWKEENSVNYPEQEFPKVNLDLETALQKLVSRRKSSPGHSSPKRTFSGQLQFPGLIFDKDWVHKNITTATNNNTATTKNNKNNNNGLDRLNSNSNTSKNKMSDSVSPFLNEDSDDNLLLHISSLSKTSTSPLGPRLLRVLFVFEWLRLSQPGAGTEILDHLDLPELRTATRDSQDSEDSDN